MKNKKSKKKEVEIKTQSDGPKVKIKEEGKIKIVGDKATTTIDPSGKTGDIISKMVYDTLEQGMPSNEELNRIGDELSGILEEAKERSNDEKTTRIIQSVQNVVENVQTTIQEKNYDEKMQEITRKLKDTELGGPLMEEGEFDEDAELIRNSLMDIFPMLTSLGREILRDREFRNIILSILEIVKNTYERIREVTSDRPGVMETLKMDVMDTSQTTPSRTTVTLKENIRDISRNVDITETEKEDLINTSINALIHLRNKPKYKEIFLNVFRIFDGLTNIWDKLRKKPALQTSYDKSTGIIKDIKILIERACGRSLRHWEGYVKEISKIVDDDLFKKLRRQIENLVIDTNNKYGTEERLRILVKKIQLTLKTLNSKYNGLFEDLAYESGEIIKGIMNDPFIKRLRDQINIVVLEAFTDSNGNPSSTVILDSITKLRDVFFPIIKERLKYVALPSIEVETDKYYFHISDVNFKLADVIPDMLHINSESDVHVDISHGKRFGFLRVIIDFSPFSTKIEELHFHMKKYKGLKYRDYGTVDFSIKNAGILFEFVMKLEADKVDSVILERVKSNLGTFKIKVRKAKHDVLDKIATKVFLPVVKGRIKKMVDEKLYDSINTEVCDRINEALATIEQDNNKKKRH